MENKKNFNWTTLVLVILLVAAAFFVGKYMEKSKKISVGTQNTKEILGANTTPTATPTLEPLETTIGRFSVTKDEVCQEDNKPSIYYFGYSGCPHCSWNHPIIQAVAKKFPAQIVFHDNMDKLDKLSEEDSKIMTKYQDIHGGAVPFLAFGCKYLRVGSGENPQEADGGKAAEDKNLTAIICKLTNNQPEKVCASVKDLVEQIK
jgi:thiol-disulfide isomerase/thioredoxin